MIINEELNSCGNWCTLGIFQGGPEGDGGPLKELANYNGSRVFFTLFPRLSFFTAVCSLLLRHPISLPPFSLARSLVTADQRDSNLRIGQQHVPVHYSAEEWMDSSL